MLILSGLPSVIGIFPNLAIGFIPPDSDSDAGPLDGIELQKGLTAC